jgi:spermidine synthase
MLPRDSRRLDLTKTSSTKLNAIFLGLCSLATQAIYLRLILSTETGGELYAALALGGWLLWVAIGSFLGKRIDHKLISEIWLVSAIIKIPIALLIFIYPGFFLGILDPWRFMPLAFLGMALPGIIYGLIFVSLIAPQTRTSLIYRNEAIGSFAGGILVTIWALLGLGDFGFLLFLSFIELSRISRHRLLAISIPIIGLTLGLLIYPSLDKLAMNLRWPEFDVKTISHGISGQWASISRGDQLTIIHGDMQLGSIPDRAASEEALLWPLLFRPQSRDMLLVGFEGMQVDKYLPRGVAAIRLLHDPACSTIDIGDHSTIETGDILSFHPQKLFDIVNIQLHGAATLYNYRMETGFFFARCKALLKDDGILFISAPSDENYISPEIARYLSSMRNSLSLFFPKIVTIPGPRVGFVCFKNTATFSGVPDSTTIITRLNISSPYFNPPLVINRLTAFKLSMFESAMDTHASPNTLTRPTAVFHYLKWQGSQFGRKAWVFNIYDKFHVLLAAIIIFIIFIILSFFGGVHIKPFSGVSAFGFLGMALEIVILYLFQMLFGTLYLHIGMIMAVFMAGLALGSASKMGLGTILIMLIMSFILVLSVPELSNSEFGLLIAGIILYICALTTGFSTGGGFAFLANRAIRGDEGAGLYGSDLMGALMAVIILPGVMISMGTFSLLLALILLSLINYAMLAFNKSWER